MRPDTGFWESDAGEMAPASYMVAILTALVVIFLFGVVVAFLTFLLHAVASAG